jgi:hypothetical protein
VPYAFDLALLYRRTDAHIAKKVKHSLVAELNLIVTADQALQLFKPCSCVLIFGSCF